MKKIFFLLFFLQFSFSAKANISDEILKNYQANLYTLAYPKQEHFSVRMYSLTGEERYLYPIMNYLVLLSMRLNLLIDNIDDKAFIESENKRLLQTTNMDAAKKILRRNKIKAFSTLAYDMNFLILLHKIYFYHLEQSPLIPHLKKGIAYLRSHIAPIQEFLLDEEMIKLYGAQLINYVNYLYELNVIDLRAPYTKQFKKSFPDKNDKNLNELDFSAKIYGMTHFIIAASNYYQKEPQASEFTWITHYFDKNIEKIIQRCENDIIAEVGVCYLLLHKDNALALQKIKRYINKTYTKEQKILPNKVKSYDLIKGEHRNILTIMIYKWHNKRFPIPTNLFQKMLEMGFIFSKNKGLNYGFDLI